MYRFRLLAIFKIRLSRDMPWLRHGRKVHGKPFLNYRSPRGSIVGLQLFRSFKFRWPRRNPEADRTTSNVTDTPKGVSKGKLIFRMIYGKKSASLWRKGSFEVFVKTRSISSLGTFHPPTPLSAALGVRNECFPCRLLLEAGHSEWRKQLSCLFSFPVSN